MASVRGYASLHGTMVTTVVVVGVLLAVCAAGAAATVAQPLAVSELTVNVPDVEVAALAARDNVANVNANGTSGDNAVNAYQCDCFCCLGNSCSRVFAGSPPVASCSSCTTSNCYSSFPSKCPSPGSAGSSQAVCKTSTAPAPATGSTAWAGTYDASGSQCSQSQ
jgi:hypothetical protein